jgi:hypothetical protein
LALAPFWNGQVAVAQATPLRLRLRLRAATSEVSVRLADPAGLFYAKLWATFAHDLKLDQRAKHLSDLHLLADRFPGGPPAMAARLRALLSPEQVTEAVDALEVHFGEGGEGADLVVDRVAGDESRELSLTRVQQTMRRLIGGLKA